MNTKIPFRRTRLVAWLLVGMLCAASGLRAQESSQPPDGDVNYNGDPSQDPPSRVARLSYIDGSVSFQPGGQGEWGAATRNRPVTIGDKIWSDNNSRAELQAGQASIHVSSMTALSLLNLDDQTTQMRLAEGTVNFRVREMREGDVYEVDTPNLAFTVTEAGAFRVDVNENGDSTRVTAIRGEGQVVANGQTYTIHTGERGEFSGTDSVSYFVASAPTPDDFDRWSNDRDRRDDDSISARYVSRDVPGYSDLDNNGTWSEEPDYGPVWYPTEVDAGWAPYSYGYWSYIGPWGWTWVDYAPWGFAPYHYGRWAFIGNRWGWCPGPYDARPIYGPAFVGFLGGAHWGVGFSFGGAWGGGIGWFPLGPRECYRPWYRTSNAYYRNVNMHNTYIRNTTVFNSRVTNLNYAYAHNAHAVTVASRGNFAGGQAINRGGLRVSEANLRGAQVTNHLSFSPTRQSYLGASANRGNIARPSAAVQNRYVVARTTPGAAAAHLPVRPFGNGNNSFGRAGSNNDRPAIQRNAAVNGNRPSSADGSNSNVRNGNASNNGGFRTDPNRPNFGATNGAPNRGQFHGGPGFDNSHVGMTARQRELAQDKPQARARMTSDSGNGRTWSAQGSTSDRGRAPAGFGSNSRTNSPRNDRPKSGSIGQGPSHSEMIRSDRPSWANGSSGNVSARSSGYPSDRPNNSVGYNRSYHPPQRSSGGYSDRPSSNGGSRGPAPPSYGNRAYSQPSFGAGNRGYSQPRSYTAPSAPSRSYSAPSRSYSAPSHSYGGSGGGGGQHSSGGGGGGSRGGSHGGGASHGRR